MTSLSHAPLSHALTISLVGWQVIIGLGEQYSRFNLKGSQFLAMSTEQGVGRGLSPLSYALANALPLFRCLTLLPTLHSLDDVWC